MKTQATTAGAVLMTLLVVRATGGGLAGGGIPLQPRTEEHAAGEQVAGAKGPWLASCAYWAPLRGGGQQAAPARPATTNSQESPGGCEGATDGWGLPQNASVTITSIIATVPDPVHSNFAVQFDRAMDALIDAGEDNGYLTSYYWLPWEKEMQKIAESLEGSSSPAAQAGAEHEPGLIIFRHSFNAETDIGRELPDPLYLFLVAETPTSGIDGQQMQRALRYQRDLQRPGVTVVRSLHPPSQIDFVGPIFSGSAISFRAAVDTEFAGGVHSVEANGITSTPWAERHLNQNPQLATPTKAAATEQAARGVIQYNSFANDASFDQTSFSDLLSGSGVPNGRMVILIEDGTTLAQASVNYLTSPEY